MEGKLTFCFNKSERQGRITNVTGFEPVFGGK
jgi:hypothetical protein